MKKRGALKGTNIYLIDHLPAKHVALFRDAKLCVGRMHAVWTISDTNILTTLMLPGEAFCVLDIISLPKNSISLCPETGNETPLIVVLAHPLTVVSREILGTIT